MPEDLESLFDSDDRYYMSFAVGGLVLDCHFFDRTEIEFSFGPEAASQAEVHDLLAFMIDIGDATDKPVLLTPENGPHCPIFRYEPGQKRLGWCPPAH